MIEAFKKNWLKQPQIFHSFLNCYCPLKKKGGDPSF